MSRNSGGDEKRAHSKSVDNAMEDEEEEEEALSLCDLPIKNVENPSKKTDKEARDSSIKTEDDFDFKSWGGGSVLVESDMCAADDVFFQGQIIPMRHSVSSEGSLAGFSRNPSQRCISRSESMDRFHFAGGGALNGVNSRSSSISSGSSSNSTFNSSIHKQRSVRNQFHSHPSPSPQIRIPSSLYGISGGQAGRKSTVWSFFRVGLVKTPPEIELQGLKMMRSTGISQFNRSSFGSRNSSSSTSSSDHNKKKKKQTSFFDNIGGGGSCKCSVDAVDTIHTRLVVVKGESDRSNVTEEDDRRKEGKTTMRKKQAMSRSHRTFEWLKELSIAGVQGHHPDDQA